MRGRSHLNFTEWDHPQKPAKDVAEKVKEGEMPPWFYLPMHPAAARLHRRRERQALEDGAGKSLGVQSGHRKRYDTAATNGAAKATISYNSSTH